MDLIVHPYKKPDGAWCAELRTPDNQILASTCVPAETIRKVAIANRAYHQSLHSTSGRVWDQEKGDISAETLESAIVPKYEIQGEDIIGFRLSLKSLAKKVKKPVQETTLENLPKAPRRIP
jgi:hypothetical protein